MSITGQVGPPITGVLVEESDFYVTLRQADGTVQTVRRAPGLKITKTNPLQAHIDLLDRISEPDRRAIEHLVTPTLEVRSSTGPAPCPDAGPAVG